MKYLIFVSMNPHYTGRVTVPFRILLFIKSIIATGAFMTFLLTRYHVCDVYFINLLYISKISSYHDYLLNTLAVWCLGFVKSCCVIYFSGLNVLWCANLFLFLCNVISFHNLLLAKQSHVF